MSKKPLNNITSRKLISCSKDFWLMMMIQKLSKKIEKESTVFFIEIPQNHNFF